LNDFVQIRADFLLSIFLTGWGSSFNRFAARLSTRLPGKKKSQDIFERIRVESVYPRVVNIVQWERCLFVVLTVCLVLGHVGRSEKGGLHVFLGGEREVLNQRMADGSL
jgi:actin-related protein